MAKKKKERKIKDITNIVEKNIEEVNIADVSEEWLKLFGGNVSVARISPNFIDVLKPVARRMLYSLYTNPN